MNKFEKGVIEVIALNSRYAIDEIALNDPLDKFFSSASSGRIGREIKRKFSKADPENITHQLFVSIKKVTDLAIAVSKYYQQPQP